MARKPTKAAKKRRVVVVEETPVTRLRPAWLRGEWLPGSVADQVMRGLRGLDPHAPETVLSGMVLLTRAAMTYAACEHDRKRRTEEELRGHPTLAYESVRDAYREARNTFVALIPRDFHAIAEARLDRLLRDTDTAVAAIIADNRDDPFIVKHAIDAGEDALRALLRHPQADAPADQLWLTEADRDIIGALRESHPVLLKQPEIVVRSGRDRTTVKVRMPALEGRGVVVRPDGPRSGYGLTDTQLVGHK